VTFGSGHRSSSPWWVFSASSVGVILAGINSSTMDVGLATVARHFDASATAASWVLLSYLLASTALILAFGRVSDIVGRRTVYVLGLGLLTAASALCGFAPTIGWLIAFRVLQAIGAAALITNVVALLADAFPPHTLSRAYGLNLAVVSTAQMLGPTVGGLLVHSFGWRAAFWFNVPFGCVGLVWAAVVLRNSPTSSRREHFDFPGAVLSTLALAGLVLALSQGGAIGWTRWPVLLGLATCLLLFPLFVIAERRTEHPLIELRMLADRARALGYLATFLMAVARFSVVLLISLYLQAAVGLNPLQAGLKVIFVPIGLAVAAPISGHLVEHVSPRLLATCGLVVSAGGLAGLALLVSPRMSPAGLSACLLAVGGGTGLFMTPNTASIMAGVTARQRGVANGVRSALQNSGFVVSSALSLAIVTGGLSPVDKRAAYAGTLSHLSPASTGVFTHGYRVALLSMATACLVGAVASVLREPARDGGSDPVTDDLDEPVLA
jgi:EmrB/QacA subfamily drug resistance transporter